MGEDWAKQSHSLEKRKGLEREGGSENEAMLGRR